MRPEDRRLRLFCEFCPPDGGPCAVCDPDRRERRRYARAVVFACVAGMTVLTAVAAVCAAVNLITTR